LRAVNIAARPAARHLARAAIRLACCCSGLLASSTFTSIVRARARPRLAQSGEQRFVAQNMSEASRLYDVVCAASKTQLSMRACLRLVRAAPVVNS